jgi:hypothetical protein
VTQSNPLSAKGSPDSTSSEPPVPEQCASLLALADSPCLGSRSSPHRTVVVLRCRKQADLWPLYRGFFVDVTLWDAPQPPPPEASLTPATQAVGDGAEQVSPEKPSSSQPPPTCSSFQCKVAWEQGVQQLSTRMPHKLLPVRGLGLTHVCLRLPLDCFCLIRIHGLTFSASLFPGEHFRGPGGRPGRRRRGAADAEDEVPAVQAAHVHDQERHQEPLHQGQGRLQGVRAEVSGGADERRMCLFIKDDAIEIVAGCYLCRFPLLLSLQHFLIHV